MIREPKSATILQNQLEFSRDTDQIDNLIQIQLLINRKQLELIINLQYKQFTYNLRIILQP